jgi:hypothetical protein
MWLQKKTGCTVRHTQKAEKFFDPARQKPEQHSEVILKGIERAKPPSMSGYADKRITRTGERFSRLYEKFKTKFKNIMQAIGNLCRMGIHI